MNVKEDVSLRDYTTFRLGGNALYFSEIEKKEDIEQAVSFVQKKALPLYVLGSGSNTIFSDIEYQGLVVHMNTKGIVLEKEDDRYVYVQVAGGEDWDAFVVYTLNKGWYGLENLSYIPGTVGAAPVQNIGAYGVEVKNYIIEVEVYDTAQNTFRMLSHEECQFAYRSSLFKTYSQKYIISSVTFRLEKVFRPILSYKDVEEALSEKQVTPEFMRETIIAIRSRKLPNWKETGTAGSFFKNPEVSKEVGDRLHVQYPNAPLYPQENGYKISAGYLIEYIAHMKGIRYKGVGVYDKHALVLVNYGDGTYGDLIELVSEIQEKVKSKTGIELVPEVNII